MIVRKLLPALAMLAMLGVPSVAPAVAQEAPPPVALFYEMEVAPVDMSAVDEALTEWSDRLGEDGETWTWNVYQSVTGPPRYVIMSSGHNWSDFDRGPTVSEDRMEENDEYMQENLLPYIKNPTATYMVHRDDVSIPGNYEEAEPAFWQVMEWEVPNSTIAYMALQNAFMKVKEAYTSLNEMAMAAGEDTGHYHVFDVMTGDGPPRILISFPMDEMGDLDGGSPMDFFNAMVMEHGHEDAVAVEETFAKYSKLVRMHFWAHRPDLSHAGEMGSN